MSSRISFTKIFSILWSGIDGVRKVLHLVILLFIFSIVISALYPSLEITAIALNSTRRHRSWARTSQPSDSCFTTAHFFRSNTRARYSSPNTDPGTVRKKSDTGSRLSGWNAAGPPVTRYLPRAGCRTKRLRADPWTCCSSAMARCCSATIKTVLSTAFVTRDPWTRV